MGIIKDMSGFEFNGCKVMKRAHQNNEYKYYWECECFCGERFLVLGTLIRKGDVKSCGCYRSKILKKQQIKNKTHGGSGTRLFRIWVGMRSRCNNEKDKHHYHDYGGRGIKVCKEWESFENFKVWSLANNYNDELSIDRIDNDKGYNPDNCRWVDMKTQARNRRGNLSVFYKGSYRTIAEIAELENCDRYKLYYRLKHNLPLITEDSDQ